MNGVLQRGGKVTIWLFAFLMAISATRYFILPTQVVNDFEDRANTAISGAIHAPPLPPIHSFSHHPLMISVHLLGGIVSIIAGLFQFVPKLRGSNPQLHKVTGYIYVTAVAVGAISGLPSPKVKLPYFVAYVAGAVDQTFSGRLMGREPRATIETVRMGKKKMWASSAKAERDLGWKTIPVDDALRRAVEWFQANGYV